MNILRRYKLSKLTGNNYFSDKEYEIINFINTSIYGLSEFTNEKHYGEHVLYFNYKGELMFVYNSFFESFGIRNKGFYESLENMYPEYENCLESMVMILVSSHIKDYKDIKTISIGLPFTTTQILQMERTYQSKNSHK